MGDSLFREGGKYQVRRTGVDGFSMKIPIPEDEDGMLGRECPNEECSPGYFKVELGTGLPGDEPQVYCPYCRHAAHQSEFHTEGQADYAVRILEEEAVRAVQRHLGSALGLGRSGKRVLADGFIKVTLSQKASPPRYVPPPVEEDLARDLFCPSCTLHHAVFGLAFWCPDCGADLFLTHVERELDSIRQVLAEVETRRAAHGNRVAARDRENALEDVVSVFEGAGKLLIWRWFLHQGKTREEAADLLERKVKNRLQNVGSASEVLLEYCGYDPLATLDEEQREGLNDAFNKRHPITHNLGVVDRKYLARARSLAHEGKELRVSCEEIAEAADLAFRVIASLHGRLFPALPPQN